MELLRQFDTELRLENIFFLIDTELIDAELRLENIFLLIDRGGSVYEL